MTRIMFCLSLKSTDPFFNLALEEILLKNRKEEFLILGINDPSVVIGKHQVPHRETNTRFITENNIPVIRRISGGGTVFHDLGNLNFSFIMQSEAGKQVDFRKYTLPVLSFLTTLGVDAKFEGKNDLKVDGLKISGNAEHIHHNRVLHHGTLLFEASLDILRNSLRKDRRNYTSRAVESNPSPVINLKEIVKNVKDITQFRSKMMSWFLDNMPDAEIYTPGREEVAEAESLAESKYRTWEWNFAYGPEYHFNDSFELNGRHFFGNFFVKDGVIRECKFEGSDQMVPVARNLGGIRHMPADMLAVMWENGVEINEDEIFRFF